jgi:hypothetical protein
MMYTELPILIFRVCCLASCLCVASNLSDSSLRFRSRSVILRKQSVRPSPRSWFISLLASVIRHSSYNLKAEIRIPVASEISTAVLAHRCKAVTAVDPYVNKIRNNFHILLGALTRH